MTELKQLGNIDGVSDQRVLLMAAAYVHAMTGTGRQIRRRLGLPMSAVAEPCGITESALSRWETGQRRPTGDAAARWAELLAELDRMVTA